MDNINREQQPEPSEQNVFQPQTNPLLIDVVLHTVFSFLDWQSLKKCRLVCKKWKKNYDPTFIQNSIFVVRHRYSNEPQNITTIFESINEDLVHFSAFKFRMVFFKVPVREIYLDPYKNTMTHLEIIANSLSDSGLRIAGRNTSGLIGPNLRRLRLISTGDPWVVSLERICSITHIDLQNCTIAINCDRKAAPNVFLLRNCSFKPNSNFPAPIYMSEIVDFRSVQRLQICGDLRAQLPKIKFGDCAKIKDIFLKKITIALDERIFPEKLVLYSNSYEVNEQRVASVELNSWLSSGEMKKLIVTNFMSLNVKITIDLENFVVSDELVIQGNIFLTRKSIKTQSKHLALEPNEYSPWFDLAFLPITVQSLMMNFSKRTRFLTSDKLCLPNLSQLFLKGALKIYPYFQNCPKLIFITLNFSGRHNLEILHLNLLPSNIRKLSFEEFIPTIILLTNKVLNLEVLYFSMPISKYALRSFIYFVKKQMFNNVQTELLVIKGHAYLGARESEKYFSPWDISAIIEMKEETLGRADIAFGPVKWKRNETLENYDLSSLVDKKSEYYLFAGQLVSGISKATFLKHIPVRETSVG